MHYLRISVVVDSDESIDEIREGITSDLEMSLDGVCRVVNITHDRELAAAFVLERSSTAEHQVLTPQVPSLPSDVATVLERYSFTLPKMRKGAPPWKVPSRALYGEIQGLHTLRGQIVLTNGIKAFLVMGNGAWADVHWNWFLADDLDALPDDLPKPCPKTKWEKTDELFAEFD